MTTMSSNFMAKICIEKTSQEKTKKTKQEFGMVHENVSEKNWLVLHHLKRLQKGYQGTNMYMYM